MGAAKPAPKPVPKKTELPKEEPAKAGPQEAPAAPAAAGADDLTRISGVGKVLVGKLNDAGVTTFKQIAELTPEGVADLDDKLSFKGRIERDNWIQQAKDLMGS